MEIGTLWSVLEYEYYKIEHDRLVVLLVLASFDKPIKVEGMNRLSRNFKKL